MENKIYIKDLESYQSASEASKKRMGKNPCYDLELLPTETMQEEMRTYIMKRSREMSAEKMLEERRYYHHLCQLIQEKGKHLKSLRDWEKEKWTRQMKAWLLSHGRPLSYIQIIDRKQIVYGKR